MSWVDMVIGDPKCAPYFNIFPDATLAVENITFSNENANEGEHVEIQTRIENHGGSNIGNLKVQYLVGEDIQNASEIGVDNVASVPTMGSSISIADWNTTGYPFVQIHKAPRHRDEEQDRFVHKCGGKRRHISIRSRYNHL